MCVCVAINKPCYHYRSLSDECRFTAALFLLNYLSINQGLHSPISQNLRGL